VSWLLSIPGAILTIAILVAVHEAGHFAAAKFFGVHVRVFSIGFGARLWGFRWKETDYRISALPFGGYVRWAGGDPFSEGGGDEEDDERVPTEALFTSKPAWQRLLINLAGPATNIALPVLLFTALLWVGEKQPEARVGGLHAGSAAEQAGIEPGDRLLRVAGQPVATVVDVEDALAEAAGTSVMVRTARDGVEQDVEVPFTPGRARDAGALGIDFYAPPPYVGVDDPAGPAGAAGVRTGDLLTRVDGVEVRDFVEIAAVLARAVGPVTVEGTRAVDASSPQGERAPMRAVLTPREAASGGADERWGLAPASVFIGQVLVDSPAHTAGLRVGDRLVSIDGRSVREWEDVLAGVAGSGTGSGEAIEARPIEIVVRRGGVEEHLDAHPRTVRRSEGGIYRWKVELGVGPVAAEVPSVSILRPYPLPEAVQRAAVSTVGLATLTVDLLGKMVTREAAASELLGGPVAVVGALKDAAESGLWDLVKQTGLISLSLGIINLVPIPIFDGGQIVMNLAEWVRGRPLPYILRERVQQVGVIMVVVLMFAVLVNDIYRRFLL